MEPDFSSPLGLSSLLLIIIGIVMAVVGIILLIANQTSRGWYIWFLLAVGTVMAIAGSVMLVIFLSKSSGLYKSKQYK